MPIALRGPRKAMRGKCERGYENANADGTGAKVFAGDGCSQGASFGPWPRFHGMDRADVYINTRARVLLRRMCVKPADLTTHSPPKTFARPRTATHPPRALPLPHAAPTHAGRLRDAFPADRTTHLPPKASARPRTATRPSRALPLAHAAPTHTRRLRDAFPADLTTPSPPKTSSRPRTATCPSRALPLPHAAPMHAHAVPTHARRLRDARPAALTTHSPQRHAAPLPFRFGHKKNGTAQCMCDAECLGRPSLRSVIWVGEPRAVRRRCGALAWRVGLRPQPWALRSRRCGRVLRA